MPISLYADAVPPLRLAGHASVFGVDYLVDGGRAWERIERGAFELGAKPTALCIVHLNDRTDTRFASTRDRTLSVWPDHHGLAFSASVPWHAGAMTIVNGLRRGELVGCSIGFDRREVEVVNAGDREVEVVRAATISEVSIVASPACPYTSFWIEDEHADDLPAYLASACLLARRTGGGPERRRSSGACPRARLGAGQEAGVPAERGGRARPSPSDGQRRPLSPG